MNRINKVEYPKVICADCGIEYGKNQYYLSRIEGQERMEVCKGCFNDEFKNDYLECLEKYNIPFIKKMWDISENNCGLYLKNITLPQFSKLRWKDSQFENEPELEETNVYQEIVGCLKKEAKKLSGRLVLYNNQGEMNQYISTIKSLKETLDLINKYNWKLTYSEYDISEESGRPTKPLTKQVSVWEQNHENQIRNHKVWNVVESIINSATINNLIKLDLINLGVKEIKCSKSFHNEIIHHSSISLMKDGTIEYKGIPLIIDETIRVESECNLIYWNK